MFLSIHIYIYIDVYIDLFRVQKLADASNETTLASVHPIFNLLFMVEEPLKLVLSKDLLLKQSEPLYPILVPLMVLVVVQPHLCNRDLALVITPDHPRIHNATLTGNFYVVATMLAPSEGYT
ncbi:hypothetical protein LguiA_015762 [Lonicera macranthoides]